MKFRYDLPLERRILGPFGRYRIQKLRSSVGGFEREFITLESTNTSISLLKLNESDCLANLENCDGFAVTIWMRPRLVIDQFSIFTAPVLKISYLTDGILVAQLSKQSMLCEVKANISKEKFSIVVVKAALSGLELYIDGTVRESCKGSKWESTTGTSNFSLLNTVYIGGQGKPIGSESEMDIYYVAIKKGIVTEENMHLVAGVSLKELKVLKFYDNWWTFSGELRFLQQFQPKLVGKFAKLVAGPDGRSWSVQGLRDENPEIVLASRDQLLTAIAQPWAIVDPTHCAAAMLSFHVKIQYLAQGVLLNHCDKYATFWYVELQPYQIEIIIQTRDILVLRQFPFHNYNRWLMLHFTWYPADPQYIAAFIGDDKIADAKSSVCLFQKLLVYFIYWYHSHP